MRETLYKIIDTLSDGEFHLGTDMGAALNITRSAIWKTVKQLSELGITLETNTQQGYRIPNGLSLLTAKELTRFVSPQNRHFLRQLHLFNEIDSTSNFLLALNERGQGNKQPQFCLAEFQSAGRGRRGRTWVSPYAASIHLSVLWHFTRDHSQLAGLSLAIAVAVIRALQHFGIENELNVKWPNDILWRRRKLGGVLIELNGEFNAVSSVVIGVGLNVNFAEDKNEHINQPWIDLSRIVQQPVNRNHIAGLMLNEIINALLHYEHYGLAGFINEWRQFDGLVDNPVTLQTANQKITGIARGINEQGVFLLEMHNGKIETFSAGDVSVRHDKRRTHLAKP
ncbi:MAG: bifunctional biotin--[acetyl-CoA-carboxylase] ligase/biotin operon repressor BirA [Gammaproteobacteria bacterium]